MTSPRPQAADPARTPAPPDVPPPLVPPETPPSPPEQVPPSREPVGVPPGPEPLGVPPTAPPEVPGTRTAHARSSGEHYCLFDTAIGPCGIAWNPRGVTRLQLPEADRAATERRLRARAAQPGEPPPEIGATIADIQRYFAGEEIDFSSIEV